MFRNYYIVCVVVMVSLCFVYYCYVNNGFMTYYQCSMDKSNIPKNPEKNVRGSIKNKNEHHACGVILHAHINKCAGGTIMKWFKKHAPTLPIGVIHRQQVEKNREKYKNDIIMYEPAWTKMIQQVDSFLANVSPKIGWKVLEVHHNSPGLMLMREYLEKWGKMVKAKGCIFYKTTILRDPLDRFISDVNWVSVPLSNINSFMESRRNWIIRYLLFGLCGYKGAYLKCEKNDWKDGSYARTPNLNENLMKEIYDIVNSLDFVGFTDNLDGYYEKIRQITGWKNEVDKVKRVHRSRNTFNLTRSLVSKFIDLNQYDYIFYYAMRNKYTQHF